MMAAYFMSAHQIEMTRFSLPLTKLIHKNLSVLMTFCLSRNKLEKLIDKKYIGEWKYLRKGLFDVAEERAERACLELAILLRALDDEEKLFDYCSRHPSSLNYGKLIFDEKPEQMLGLIDVCNKIIHASKFQWDLSVEDNPKLVCTSLEPKRWVKAEINIISLTTFCGELMH